MLRLLETQNQSLFSAVTAVLTALRLGIGSVLVTLPLPEAFLFFLS